MQNSFLTWAIETAGVYHPHPLGLLLSDSPFISPKCSFKKCASDHVLVPLIKLTKALSFSCSLEDKGFSPQPDMRSPASSLVTRLPHAVWQTLSLAPSMEAYPLPHLCFSHSSWACSLPDGLCPCFRNGPSPRLRRLPFLSQIVSKLCQSTAQWVKTFTQAVCLLTPLFFGSFWGSVLASLLLCLPGLVLLYTCIH